MPKIEPANPYAAAFDLAIDELDALMTEREAIDEKRDTIDRRIGSLRKGVIGLGALCGLTPDSIKANHSELFPEIFGQDTGLTDAVREVLKSNEDDFCSPVFIRDTLKQNGYEIGKYKNALASIHTVLKRLKTRGEVSDSNREGRTVYKWKPPAPQGFDISDEDIPF